jgi:hypothetical protein
MEEAVQILAYDTEKKSFCQEAVATEKYDAKTDLFKMSELRKKLNCRIADYREFKIGDNTYEVWFDEEFLYNKDWSDELHPTIALGKEEGWLNPPILIYGNVIIGKYDKHESQQDLDDEDQHIIFKWLEGKQKNLLKEFDKTLGEIRKELA